MATTTILKPSRLPFPAPAVHYVCESWLTCGSSPGTGYLYRERVDSLLATGQPLSVVPLGIQQFLALEITPAPGWKGQVPTWFGVACRIGRLRIWLPVWESPGTYREFSLLALLPRAELDDSAPLLQLGTQFLLEHRAQVVLGCTSPRQPGKLLIP
jgi:hypothetical protein